MKRRAFSVKRDANEPEIVDALEKVGATVRRMNWADLLVGFRGVNYVIEVKTEKGKLTDNQIVDFPAWRGQVDVARTKTEALKLIGAIK